MIDARRIDEIDHRSKGWPVVHMKQIKASV